MRRRRILLVIAGLPAGGAERQMSLLARHLDRERFEVGLLIFGRQARVHYREALEGLDWFRALELGGGTPRPLLPLKLLAGLRRAVADFRPDVVHSSLNKANHAVRLAKALGGVPCPVVTSVRTPFRRFPGLERMAEHLLVRWSARVVTNSEAVRAELLADLGLAPERVVVVPNAVDSGFLAETAPPPPEWWPHGHPVALMVGRFVPLKNHLAVMAAAARLERDGRLGDWRFVLVGEGPLEQAIRDAAPPGRVVLASPVADLLPFYRAATLVLLPSAWEGMPNVALEAQATGCPVALSPAANASGVVDPAEGWLLEGDLALSLAAVLAEPAEAMRQRGAAARRRVAERHAAAAMAAATGAVLEIACSGPASAAT